MILCKNTQDECKNVEIGALRMSQKYLYRRVKKVLALKKKHSTIFLRCLVSLVFLNVCFMHISI